MDKYKTALITGVSRGIGQAICQTLLNEGFQVYGTYFKTETKKTDNLTLLKVDLTNRASSTQFLDKLKKVKFDVIINNAGIINFDKFSNLKTSSWDQVLEINLTAPLLIIQALQKNLNPGGTIINIASTDGLTGSFSSLSYSASKAALINLTKSLANILGEKQIRVNSISPGWIETDMATLPSQKASTLTPLKRNGQPEEVANLVSFLISDKASFINGANLILDGGYSNVDFIMKEET